MAERGATLFLALALVVLVVAFLLIQPVLAAVVLALTVGHLVHPQYTWLERHLPRQWPAATIVLVSVAVMLVAPFVILIALFFDEARRVVEGIESRADVAERIEDALGGLGVPKQYLEGLGTEVISSAASWLRGEAAAIATIATDFLIGLVVFFILLFYTLVDGRGMVARLHKLPAPDVDIDRVLGKISDRVKAIVFGTVGVAVIQAVIAALGWWLLGLPAPVFWGFVMLVLELVPVIGAFVILLPAAIWAFLNGDVWTGVGLLVLNFVMVGLIDDLLRPYIIGRRSGVHPALILIGIVGGLTVFGLSGLILGPLLIGILEPLYDAWAEPAGGTPPAADVDGGDGGNDAGQGDGNGHGASA